MNRNKRTERRALVARVESLEGRISLSATGTTITKITNPNLFVLSAYHVSNPNPNPSPQGGTTATGGGTTITRYSGPGFTLSGYGHSS